MNSEEDEFKRIEAEALRQSHQSKEPTPWRDMIVASLVREGINKHRARELADHFAAQPAQERNFCPRCGKRTADLTVIHTCTPPQEKNSG